MNELQYVINELFDEMTSRAGRYPAIKDGGPTWHGVIADMNVPDSDHLIAMMRGMVPWPEGLPEDERSALAWPATWDFFMQPPGLLEVRGSDGIVIGYDDNPKAENTKWLPENYYGNMIAGKKPAWIKSRVLNQIALGGRWRSGVARLHAAPACCPRRAQAGAGQSNLAWRRFRHVARRCSFAQSVNNRVNILDELQGHNTAATTFAPQVKRYLEQKYGGFSFVAFGDPKGQDRTQTDERTAYDIFAANGIPMKAAPVKQNLISTRIEAVEYLLGQLYDGRPRLQISPNCRTLIAGMSGGYCYERRFKSTEIKTEPSKNRFSHLADALQYLASPWARAAR